MRHIITVPLFFFDRKGTSVLFIHILKNFTKEIFVNALSTFITDLLGTVYQEATLTSALSVLCVEAQASESGKGPSGRGEIPINNSFLDSFYKKAPGILINSAVGGALKLDKKKCLITYQKELRASVKIDGLDFSPPPKIEPPITIEGNKTLRKACGCCSK